MHKMLQLDEMADLVIATGRTSSLMDFAREAFSAAGLEWSRHVRHTPSLLRPTEIDCGRADPSRAKATIGWRARHAMPDVARMMVQARMVREATP
jgi:GDPmannose 4,6-dehydratase